MAGAAVAARAVVSASTEVATARYVFITSATAAARGGLLEAVAASLLAARRGLVEAVAASLSAARGEGWVPVPLRPHACSLVVAGVGDLKDRDGSGSRVEIPPPPRAYPLLAPLVSASRVAQTGSRGLSFLAVRPRVIEARPGDDDDDDDDAVPTRSSVGKASVLSTTRLPRAYACIVAARPGEGDDGGFMEPAIPPRAYSFVVVLRPDEGDGEPSIPRPPHKSSIGLGGPKVCVKKAATGMSTFFIQASTRPRSIFRTATCSGPLGLGHEQKMFAGPPVLNIGWRHHWAWTPWNTEKPDTRSRVQILHDIVKHVDEMEWSEEEELKLKSVFLKRFYPGDPKSADMRFDMVLIKLDQLPNQIAEAQSKDKKTAWGTIKVWGRKIDLSKLLAFVGFFVKS